MAEQLSVEDIETVEPVSMSLVLPTTGEVISREDPDACARAFFEIKTLEERLKELRGALAEALLEESRKTGGKTLHLEGGFTAKISISNDIHWDHSVLLELLDAGLPEERFGALVTTEVSYKVNGSIAREVAGANEVYAEIIDRAKNKIPRSPYVSVTQAS